MIEMRVVLELDNKGKPVIKEYDRCLRCGRKLKDEKYRKIGFGPVCMEKEFLTLWKENEYE